MFLIDSHCHIDKICKIKKNKNFKNILKKAFLKKVKLILIPSTSLKNFKKLKKKYFNKFNNIFYSCGIHPLKIKNLKEFKKIKKYSLNKSVIAIGETGLDYFHQKKNKKKQQIMFRKHIRLAINIKKPIIVHCRNSSIDTIKILKNEQANLCQGILHSFNLSKKDLTELLDLNFYISISGMITFKNIKNLKKILKFIPLNRLLIETDSPYLTPEPYRGKKNQPAYLYEILLYIAKILKFDIKELSKILKKNFFSLFKIKKIKKHYFI